MAFKDYAKDFVGSMEIESGLVPANISGGNDYALIHAHSVQVTKKVTTVEGSTSYVNERLDEVLNDLMNGNVGSGDGSGDTGGDTSNLGSGGILVNGTYIPLQPSGGLIYKKISGESGGDYYVCSSIGTATDKDIVIASEVDGISVTGIGANAFKGTSIVNVVMPDTITSIGDHAFYQCLSLTGVGMSQKVTSIGAYAFEFCSKLKTITLPDSLTSVGQYAFQYCSKIMSVVLSKSVETVGQYAFGMDGTVLCEAESVPAGWDAKWNKDGAGYWTQYVLGVKKDALPTGGLAYTEETDNAGKVISYLCSGLGVSTDTNIVIPDNVYGLPVTSVPASAFEGTKIEKVTIPDTVVAIAKKAFANCKSLNKITIGKGVENIGARAFQGSNSFYSITIPKSVWFIDEYAFYDCVSSLKIKCEAPRKPNAWSPYWVDKNSGITVEWTAVSEDRTVNALYRKVNNLGTLGLEYASNDGETWCEGIGSITDSEIIIDSEYFGQPVTKITESAFAECTQLTSVVIPDSVTNILDMAFWGCSNLKSVTIPKSVTDIGESAFANCTALESIIIPASVLYMYDGTFSNCPNLTIYCEAESQPADWEDGWNRGCPVIWGYAPDIESVNTKLKKLANSSGSSGTGDATGREPSVGCSYSLSADGTQYSCTGVRRQNLVDTVDVVIASEIDGIPVTSINAEAFKDNKYIKSVYMPDSITSIGSSAFWGCSDITNVTISDSVASIGDNAFYNCYNLTSITIPDSVTSIGNYAFDHCSNLTSVTIGNGVTSIGAGAFYTCTSLPLVTIPKSVTSIGGYAFEKCTNLTIYCKTESKPNGWVVKWNIDNRPVVWGWINDFEGVNEKFKNLTNIYRFDTFDDLVRAFKGASSTYNTEELCWLMHEYFATENIKSAEISFAFTAFDSPASRFNNAILDAGIVTVKYLCAVNDEAKEMAELYFEAYGDGQWNMTQPTVTTLYRMGGALLKCRCVIDVEDDSYQGMDWYSDIGILAEEIGSISTALDSIISIQNALIGE